MAVTTRAVKCIRCENGWRHPAGNCVLCGQGPAPMAMEYLPQTHEGKELAVFITTLDPDMVPAWRTDWDKEVHSGRFAHIFPPIKH